MITKTLSPKYYEVEVTVKEIMYGNTFIDKITNTDIFGATTLRLRCTDCTIMVFKEDFELVKGIGIGSRFKAVVKEWKMDVYNFKGFINE